MNKTNSLSVSEQFFSIQGEGISAGIPAYFLRLSGCNLMCGGQGTEKDGQLHNGATWRCDTIETWLRGTRKSFDDIIKGFGSSFIQRLQHRNQSHLVITGGEPLIQSEALWHFLNKLKMRVPSAFVEVETNGTINPRDEDLHKLVDQWNVSPKLSNSGMEAEKRINRAALLGFSDLNAWFKFVVTNPEEALEAFQDYAPQIKVSRMMFMPGADNDHDLVDVSRVVAEVCKKTGVRFSPRLHISIYNQKVGV